MLPRDIIRYQGMDKGLADKAEILTVIRSETEAWLQRDFEALSSHWLHAPHARRMEYYASLGIRVDEGWDAIAKRFRVIVDRFPEKQSFSEKIRWEKLNVIVAENMAWVTYDQIGLDGSDDIKRELKILHKIEGNWKIACVVMMEGAVEQANCPLIEVDINMRILWTNRLAQDRLRNHQGLVIIADRLHARRRSHNPALREAVKTAYQELQGQTRLILSPKQSWTVSLGKDDSGAPIHCWIHLEDGKTLVSFDDLETLERRMKQAQEIYGLSPAQIKLAQLIVDGHDLSEAARVLAVSVNTVRTHLQRIFDKTGARNQAALVRSLLCIEAPNK